MSSKNLINHGPSLEMRDENTTNMELYEYFSSAPVGGMLGYLRNEICTMHMFLQENMTMLKQNSLNHMQKWWYLDCFINKWRSNLLRLDYATFNDLLNSIVKYHQIWRSFIYQTIKISSFLHVILYFLLQHCNILLQNHFHRTYLVA